MNETRGIEETQVKDRLRREYIRRQYSFGVVNWKIKELENIDRQTRKMLTTYKMHHPKADVDRLYTSRKDGGRGLMQNDKYVGSMKIARRISEEIQIEERGNETEENNTSGLCEEHEETTEHIIAGCTILAKHEYIKRHDQVCRNLHYNICKEYGIEVGKKWYEHKPQPTDREIRANKPDIVIKLKKENKCLIIDVAVPGDRRVKEKEAEKVLKCKELTLETQRMWNCRTKVIPVVIGALGTITNSFKNYIKESLNINSPKVYRKTYYLARRTY
ncbi:hypothetical protein ILUMI_21582 [Ignelater luminosus]|uniref:Reverse transcriptase n=1 Tax=Ignelater luminosus TaxID=2038154 RepID=A0A8K0G3K1_IGNLU|nr:hypothetical protein ILUMI_21582 [Ignelater luminosus]